jgi:hypothetical protein
MVVVRARRIKGDKQVVWGPFFFIKFSEIIDPKPLDNLVEVIKQFHNACAVLRWHFTLDNS